MRADLRAWLCALLLSASSASAQVDREEFQSWTAAIATVDVEPAPPSFSGWLDVHARRGATGTVMILRPGVGVQIAPFVSVWGGYAWVPTFRDATDDAVHEHRIWQQAIVQHRTDFRLALQSRTRLEQRFSDQGGDVAVRLRQFVRVGWDPWPDFPLGVVVWDELFLGFNDTDWGAVGGFDQNRLFGGAALTMAPWARLEAGYLFVYLDRSAGDLFAHVLAVNLFISVRPPPPPQPVP